VAIDLHVAPSPGRKRTALNEGLQHVYENNHESSEDEPDWKWILCLLKNVTGCLLDLFMRSQTGVELLVLLVTYRSEFGLKVCKRELDLD